MRTARAMAVTSCGFEHLRDVLVPDGQGGTLHVDFLLLTARGVVVIDLRDVEGNIFGGDQMTEWTVMHRALRYTFAESADRAVRSNRGRARTGAGIADRGPRVFTGAAAAFPRGCRTTH